MCMPQADRVNRMSKQVVRDRKNVAKCCSSDFFMLKLVIKNIKKDLNNVFSCFNDNKE